MGDRCQEKQDLDPPRQFLVVDLARRESLDKIPGRTRVASFLVDPSNMELRPTSSDARLVRSRRDGCVAGTVDGYVSEQIDDGPGAQSWDEGTPGAEGVDLPDPIGGDRSKVFAQRAIGNATVDGAVPWIVAHGQK